MSRAIRDFRSEASKAVRAVAPAVNAAISNEQITRERVDRIEAWLRLFTGMGFWRRMKWICTGK